MDWDSNAMAPVHTGHAIDIGMPQFVHRNWDIRIGCMAMRTCCCWWWWWLGCWSEVVEMVVVVVDVVVVGVVVVEWKK